MKFSLVVLLLLPILTYGQCPYFQQNAQLPKGHPPVLGLNKKLLSAQATINYNLVKQDIKAVLTNSQDFWPADFGNYGPFFVRLAWHCSGSYRTYDGHGGCDGGRQRFDPERSWDDNTNLDKARTLLWTVKEKYGEALSWGDLFILAGTTAIESMGGPVLGFCGGRIDDADGTDSLLLGPTAEQEAMYPCPVNGKCEYPLGSTTVGLIYVNPEGPMGVPDPAQSALQIRDVFGRMNMNDAETVALIGGGHAFGKAHGACPNGAGPSPAQDPSNPWPGLCGSGKGNDTFTSGFEGAWTDNPIVWSNDYFKNLIELEWNVIVGPGGKHQWVPKGSTSNDLMMLTTDMGLINDPTYSYQQYVKLFASNVTALEEAFSHAWYKLVTRDMGPVTRCIGDLVPPAQPFQFPLPPTPSVLAPFSQIRLELFELLSTANSLLPADVDANGKPTYAALFSHLAWQCASTFRVTDYQGGCNGATIRFAPESEWLANRGLDKALEMLQPIKARYGDSLSWADLIVLAGTTAVEMSTGKTLAFCGGRTDATDGSRSHILQPAGDLSLSSASVLRERAVWLGLTPREFVAIAARLRSPSQQSRIGYSNTTWTTHINVVSNEYFRTLLAHDWQEQQATSGSGLVEYVAKDEPSLVMTPVDLQMRWQAEWLAIVQDFAADNALFIDEFVRAWGKMMNADRFDASRPSGNVCY